MLLARPPTANAASFASIFEENASYVWRVARNLGVSEADVEDICQEVFLAVHHGLAGFRGESSMRTWIYGICFRVVSVYRRRPYHRREETAGDALPDTSFAAPQEDDVDRSRLVARLHAALDRLDEDKRAVFVLYELEERTMAEVAAIVECPLQTAYSRLYAARRAIDAVFASDTGSEAQDRKEVP
jgi:RNA polymerase sigma-70 factor, ECF subfamily